ncbi:MAG: hypothetical protein J3K34DRAFT_456604, partial [Monoraphidium minutum]
MEEVCCLYRGNGFMRWRLEAVILPAVRRALRFAPPVADGLERDSAVVPEGAALDLRSLHPLLGDPERLCALLYGSLWRWALANLSGELALLARRVGVPGRPAYEMLAVEERKMKVALACSETLFVPGYFGTLPGAFGAEGRAQASALQLRVPVTRSVPRGMDAMLSRDSVVYDAPLGPATLPTPAWRPSAPAEAAAPPPQLGPPPVPWSSRHDAAPWH